MSINPYSTPTTVPTTAQHDGHGVYRSDKLLVITKHFEAPPICTFTGEPAVEGQLPKKLKLSYSGNAATILLALLLGLLPAIIVIAIFGKKVTMDTYISEQRIQKRKRNVRRCLTILLISIIISVVGILLDSKNASNYIIVSGILALISPFFLLIKGRVLVKKWKKGHFYLSGIHPNILALFPPEPDILINPKKLAKEQKKKTNQV